MSLSDLVGKGFIWAVGITPPKPGKERTAALFITGALLAIVVAAGVTLFVLLHQF